jgi:hypothetical protein
VPIARRSAIPPTVIVVSARKRAAKATFTESPLGRVLISASCHRPRFNSSAMINYASASAHIRSLFCVSILDPQLAGHDWRLASAALCINIKN